MALTESENLPARAPMFRLPSPLRAWLSSERGAIQRMAGAAFVIRVAGAVVIFLSQILLARWIGGVEFGIYVYAWTWLQMVGDIIHLGLPLTAQRIVPEYTQRNDLDGLRGFLLGVSIRHRPQAAYLSPSERLSSVGSSLYILMRSIRFSIPKSVNAITPSSPTP